MTALKTVVLNCDIADIMPTKPWSRRCVAAYVGHAGQDEDGVRADSHRNGWRTASTEKGVHDYCPHHQWQAP